MGQFSPLCAREKKKKKRVNEASHARLFNSRVIKASVLAKKPRGECEPTQSFCLLALPAADFTPQLMEPGWVGSGGKR